MAKKKKGRRLARLLMLGFVLVAAAGVGWLGWQWQDDLLIERIETPGARHALPDSLLALARVDTGLVLYDVDPVLVEDRVRRHPWVESAEVSRLPTGTLSIRVQERRPVALVMSRGGTPSHYLDRQGFALPLTDGAAYDVPLLHGLNTPYHPLQPIEDTAVQALLAVLAGADAATRALVSELELHRGGEVTLYTPPTTTQGALQVRLGHAGFAEKLTRLHAFWHQAVLPRPNHTFTRVDLRFDSQIVTEEGP